MIRSLMLVFGVASYGLFFVTFLAAFGFFSGLFGPFAGGGSPAGLGEALLVNGGLLAVFALQHSVMARPGFKRVWTKVVPAPVERSVYVLASSLALLLLMAEWRAIGGELWAPEGAWKTAVLAVQGLGWALVFYATTLIDHFDLFGLRQVVLAFQKRAYTEKAFRTPSLYKHVRHPIYVGWMVVLWAAPVMTWDRLVLAAGSTAYILVAIVFEERDLIQHFGARYREYKEAVPALLPRRRGAKSERRRAA